MLIRYWHESGTQFIKSDIKGYTEMYGKNILIGGDPGWDEDFTNAMKWVDYYGAKKHVYLTGPGMMEWSSEERQEIKNNAKSVGIDINKKSWQDEWFKKGGWEKKVHAWFIEYNKQNFYSAEVDNLDAIWEQDPDDYLDFIIRFDKFHRDNNIKTKLMIKNLSEEQLERLIKFQPREGLLCEFGMFEAGSGNSSRQLNLAAKLGIQAVTPKNGLRDTNNYGVTRHGVPYLIK